MPQTRWPVLRGGLAMVCGWMDTMVPAKSMPMVEPRDGKALPILWSLVLSATASVWTRIVPGVGVGIGTLLSS